MMDFTLTFSSKRFDSRHVEHLIVQSKYKALLTSEVVNFIPNTTRSGLGKSLTLIGYSG